MPSHWLLRNGDGTTGDVRLFCFPFAGGGAASFFPWRQASGQIDVQPVRLPGREGRIAERPVVRLSELIDQLSYGLADYVDEPFAVFGHSMGALLAFELARRLEREGRPPLRLFVSGRMAPMATPAQNLHSLPDTALIQWASALGATPERVLTSPEMRDVYLPVLRADLELCETYTFTSEPRLKCPVSTFYGYDEGYESRDLLGWRDVTDGPWKCQGFPGTHFFPFKESSPAVLNVIVQDVMTDHLKTR